MALSRFIPKAKHNHTLSADFVTLSADSALAKTPSFDHLINKFKTPYLTTGHQGQRRSGTGADFWQYKEYQDGDNSQNIDWRKSAKGDTHFIREREWEKSQTVSIWLSRSKSMQFVHKLDTYSKAQYATVLAYILSAKFIQTGEQIKFINAQIKGLHSAAQLQQLAHGLTQHSTHVTAHNKNDIGIAKSFPILISDYWDDIATVERQIRQLSADNFRGLILQITSPAEISLPYKGRVRLEHAAQGESDHFTISKIEDTKKEYTARIDKHQTALRAIAHKYGCHFLQVSTDQPFTDATMDIYRTLAGLAPNANNADKAKGEV